MLGPASTRCTKDALKHILLLDNCLHVAVVQELSNLSRSGLEFLREKLGALLINLASLKL